MMEDTWEIVELEKEKVLDSGDYQKIIQNFNEFYEKTHL